MVALHLHKKTRITQQHDHQVVTEFSQQNWVYPNHEWSKKEPYLNCNPKRLPKEILGFVWPESSQNRQQMIQFHPKRGGLSLTLMDQGQTYNPKCNLKQLPNKTLGFSWDDSVHSTHNTAKFCDCSV